MKVQSSEAKKAGTILHSSTSSVEAVRQAFDYASSEGGLINKAALILVLRKKLKSVKRKDLWDNPKVESFAEGEASPPCIRVLVWRTCLMFFLVDPISINTV